MRVVLFCHSLLSDWNHGNAHFLRGVCTELLDRGHEVAVYEPHDAWSLQNLVQEHGAVAVEAFRRAYPRLGSTRYVLAGEPPPQPSPNGGGSSSSSPLWGEAGRGAATPETTLTTPQVLDLHAALANADLVIVHEWNDHTLVARIGEHRRDNPHYRLLFHDTHHRSVTEPSSMAAYDLRHYDGVLAFGNVIRDLYRQQAWAQQAWTWHEAADTRVFAPRPGEPREGDLVWIGNWGDEERTAELHEFLLQPVKDLGLHARVHGVRYPEHARQALRDAGIEYAGWLANHEAPRVFARFAVTVHVPRRPYVQALPGIPTIRVFEALACGIPLVSAPWNDAEGLFKPGADFLVARDGAQMRKHLSDLLNDPALARSVADHGRRTVLARHSCAHRVDELMAIYDEMGPPGARSPASQRPSLETHPT